jgi:hypothetical protein
MFATLFVAIIAKLDVPRSRRGAGAPQGRCLWTIANRLINPIWKQIVLWMGISVLPHLGLVRRMQSIFPVAKISVDQRRVNG